MREINTKTLQRLAETLPTPAEREAFLNEIAAAETPEQRKELHRRLTAQGKGWQTK